MSKSSMCGDTSTGISLMKVSEERMASSHNHQTLLRESSHCRTCILITRVDCCCLVNQYKPELVPLYVVLFGLPLADLQVTLYAHRCARYGLLPFGIATLK